MSDQGSLFEEPEAEPHVWTNEAGQVSVLGNPAIVNEARGWWRIPVAELPEELRSMIESGEPTH